MTFTILSAYNTTNKLNFTTGLAVKEFTALSIVYPAVTNILLGIKKVEIRSWTPPRLPMRDVLLIENRKYLHDGDVDPDAKAVALVDIISVIPWTYLDSQLQDSTTKITKEWKPGYFMWEISNIRKIAPTINCIAKKGFYTVKVEINNKIIEHK